MKRTPLRRMSRKRARELPAYREAKAALPDRCEIRVEGVCTGATQDGHHWWAQGRGGPLLPGPTQRLIGACRACHEVVTNDTRWARENGWLK